jgi:hypothetical protein
MNWMVYCQYLKLSTGKDVTQLTPLSVNHARAKIQCSCDTNHDGTLFELAQTGDTKNKVETQEISGCNFGSISILQYDRARQIFFGIAWS